MRGQAGTTRFVASLRVPGGWCKLLSGTRCLTSELFDAFTQPHATSEPQGTEVSYHQLHASDKVVSSWFPCTVHVRNASFGAAALCEKLQAGDEGFSMPDIRDASKPLHVPSVMGCLGEDRWRKIAAGP